MENWAGLKSDCSVRQCMHAHIIIMCVCTGRAMFLLPTGAHGTAPCGYTYGVALPGSGDHVPVTSVVPSVTTSHSAYRLQGMAENISAKHPSWSESRRCLTRNMLQSAAN